MTCPEPVRFALLSLLAVPAVADAKCVNTSTGTTIGTTAGQPQSGQSVVCDATAPNPTTAISAAAGSSDVHILINAGSILNPGVRAVGVVNNSTVINNGTIRTSALNAFGITATGTGSVLTNAGTITTTSTHGYGLDARGFGTTLVNSGVITTSAINSAGIRTTETTPTTTLTNSGTINVLGGSSAPDYGPGILFQSAAATAPSRSATRAR